MVTYRSVNALMDPTPGLVEAACQVLADPTRRAILDVLHGGEQTAGALAERFPISRPAVSRHLRVLRHASLVRETRRGRNRVYRLDTAPLRALDTWLDRYRIFWAARLTDLRDVVEARRRDQGADLPKSPDDDCSP